MPEKLELDDSVAGVLRDALKLDGFFPEFTSNHAKMVFIRSALYLYSKGEKVIEQGDTGRDLFIVYQGKAEVVRNKTRLGFLKDRDVFGEIGMLGDGVRSATVAALEDSKIFRLAYQDIQYLLENNKALGQHLDALIRERKS